MSSHWVVSIYLFSFSYSKLSKGAKISIEGQLHKSTSIRCAKCQTKHQKIYYMRCVKSQPKKKKNSNILQYRSTNRMVRQQCSKKNYYFNTFSHFKFFTLLISPSRSLPLSVTLNLPPLFITLVDSHRCQRRSHRDANKSTTSVNLKPLFDFSSRSSFFFFFFFYY